MALTSLGALFLSAMAVYLLSRTLRQGEDINNAAIAAANAANETNAIMRQEQRPWVVFERKIGCDFSVEGKTVTLKWNYRLLNKGKTPAFAVRVSTRIISEDGWQPSSSSLEDFFDMSFARAKSQKSSRTVFPASEGIEWTDFQTGTKIGDMKKEFYLLVMVNYRLWQTSEGDWGHDLRVFHIELNEGPDEEFSAYPYVLTEYSTLRHTG